MGAKLITIRKGLFMKERQYKKLCKKAAASMGFKSCVVEDGIWFVCWDCSGMDYKEYDSQEAWDYMVGVFDSEVNTMVDENSECGISWKPESQQIKSTPKNVLAWARANYK